MFVQLLARLFRGQNPEFATLHGVPQLPSGELPALPGFTYPPTRQVGPVQIPAMPDPPAVHGFLSQVVERADGAAGMPSAGLQVLRLAPGLTATELDGVVARYAYALGGTRSTTGWGGTTVHTVVGLQALWLRMSAVVFRRGADVVHVSAPDTDLAWAVATAYLEAAPPGPVAETW